jgi:hypothetical protein
MIFQQKILNYVILSIFKKKNMLISKNNPLLIGLLFLQDIILSANR